MRLSRDAEGTEEWQWGADAVYVPFPPRTEGQPVRRVAHPEAADLTCDLAWSVPGAPLMGMRRGVVGGQDRLLSPQRVGGGCWWGLGETEQHGVRGACHISSPREEMGSGGTGGTPPGLLPVAPGFWGGPGGVQGTLPRADSSACDAAAAGPALQRRRSPPRSPWISMV